MTHKSVHVAMYITAKGIFKDPQYNLSHSHRMNTIELSSPIMLLNHGRYDIGVAELADDYICVAIYAAGLTLSILLD